MSEENSRIKIEGLSRRQFMAAASGAAVLFALGLIWNREDKNNASR